LSLQIVTKTKLTEQDKESLFRWGTDLWDNDRYALTWRSTDIHCVGYEENVAVTQAGACLHILNHESNELRIGGLNGVITRPEARGKGYGNLVVGAAEAHMRDEMDADFGMLFCHPELEPYYDSRGWVKVESPVTIVQPEGPRKTSHTVMVLAFRNAVWSDTPVVLNSLPW
jgi:GNAT superfamily N-acetyltransferase